MKSAPPQIVKIVMMVLRMFVEIGIILIIIIDVSFFIRLPQEYTEIKCNAVKRININFYTYYAIYFLAWRRNRASGWQSKYSDCLLIFI